jgi:hypothetical protein
MQESDLIDDWYFLTFHLVKRPAKVKREVRSATMVQCWSFKHQLKRRGIAFSISTFVYGRIKYGSKKTNKGLNPKHKSSNKICLLVQFLIALRHAGNDS